MKVLIPAEQIKKRIEELAAEITEYYAGKELTVVAVMNGAMIFCADLIREIKLPVILDSVSVASYEHLSSTGVINFRCDVKMSLEGRHVLLVDDIFDTGFTVSEIMKHFRQSGALSTECCCLLNKKDVKKKVFCPKWTGFDIPKVFVVGYGLDADEKYRNLPDVCDLES